MIELFKLHSMRYSEKEIEHRQRLKNGLNVKNELVYKTLPPEKQKLFEKMCNDDLKKTLEQINHNYNNIFGL